MKKNVNDKIEVDNIIENNKTVNFDNYLSWAQCQEFCKNVRQISVQYGNSLTNNFADRIEVFFTSQIIKKLTKNYTIFLIYKKLLN